MGSILSQVLLAHKFMPVQGTTEKVGVEKKTVSKGAPFTWDTNNGVSVVYDENGHPWIVRGEFNPRRLYMSYKVDLLTRGAYVPHSNDGGQYIQMIARTEEGTTPSPARKMKSLSIVLAKILARAEKVANTTTSGGDNHIGKIMDLCELGQSICSEKDEAHFLEDLNKLILI